MKTLTTALLLTVLSAAQDKPPYKPMGAPPAPRVPAQWNRYHDTHEVTELFQKLAQTHPARCRLESLGLSYGKREMWLMTITSFDKGHPQSKPAFWIDGGIHANEIQGTEVAAYTAWMLLESYGENETITRLVDERAFYIVPMMSPDARDAHMYEPNSTHSPRSGLRPVDDDRDGFFDEDGPDDMDGDGHITQMRIADPNGRWKKHPDFPNLLVRAKPDERGEYTLLGSEGFDNDGDGRVNEDGVGYYDPNRDWAWNWQPHHVQHGAYRYPFSIFENRVVAEFVTAHPNIAGAQSYHNSGGMILYGPGAKDDRYEEADQAVYRAIGKAGEQMLPGYKYMNVAHELYEVYGGELDWFYGMNGVFAFTNELFTDFNFFRRASGEEGPFGRREELHAFNRYLLFEEGLVPWKEVKHPQYGVVEIGGVKKNWTRQPPSFLLEEECHRNMAFTLYHADQMPQVSVASIETRALAGGLTEVTATIANPKLTPTRSAVDVKRKITPPDRATIEGRNVEVVAGMVSESRFFTRPEEQKLNPRNLRIESIPGMGARHVRWIVRGAGPYTVTVTSIKGGTVSRTH
ncbi:MAG: peptidase M14 [Planctomycetes bacterium]|nr:peptidase M14 [Planctomycetota bacterium]